MANFTALKTAINNAIKTNGNEEITGAILQAILDAMVETLGDSAINDLENAITTEVTNRENAVGGVADDLAAEALARANKDNLLDNRINAEEYNRQNADAALSQTMSQGFQTLGSQMTALNAAISALNAAYQNGYLYGGIATPSSSPSNNKCFYIALQGGTYTNFGGVGVVEGINIIKNDSGWKVEHIYDQTTLLNEFYLLRQQVIRAISSIDPIVIQGDVTNAPDEEDLTSDAQNLLKFKDRAYSPLNFSGLGMKILRKNIAPLSDSAAFNGFVEDVTAEETLAGTPELIFWDRMNTRFIGIKDGIYYAAWTDDDNYVPVSTSLVYMYNGIPYQWTGSDFTVDETEVPNLVNCLTQDMINEANTIYIIRYDYTLKENITIPANCVLQFDGGSISGEHTITGANTGIQAGLVKIFSTDVTLAGTWNVAEAYPEWFGAVGDEVIDCTSAIQKTLETFSCCYFHEGIYKITSHINVTGNIYGQYSKSIIKPYHDGDVFRLTAANKSIIGLTVKGGEWDGPYTQPRTGTAGAAFVVGYNGANPQNCRIQDCIVYVFYGMGVLWEHGSKLIIENAIFNKLTSDGIRCTANYNDNNEGTFLNTHIMNCSGIGYNVMDGETMKDVNASRCHCFINTKAFKNNRNYYIGTIGNYGSVMSELGTNPDTFGSKSAGNKFFFYSTETAYQGIVDNGGLNVISGYSNWNGVWDNNKYIRNLYINNQKSGYQLFHQTDNYRFEDTITGTNNNPVIVSHSKGDARARRDEFEKIACKNCEDTFEVVDSAWYSPFRPNGNNPNGGAHPLTIKNTKADQTRFINGFEVAPESFNGNPSWCMGIKDEIPLRCFIGSTEIWNGTIADGMKVLVEGKKENPAILLSGTKANAPTVTKVGFMYFCTDITPARPIWWNGTAWVDATGATV